MWEAESLTPGKIAQTRFGRQSCLVALMITDGRSIENSNTELE